MPSVLPQVSTVFSNLVRDLPQELTQQIQIKNRQSQIDSLVQPHSQNFNLIQNSLYHHLYNNNLAQKVSQTFDEPPNALEQTQQSLSSGNCQDSNLVKSSVYQTNNQLNQQYLQANRSNNNTIINTTLNDQRHNSQRATFNVKILPSIQDLSDSSIFENLLSTSRIQSAVQQSISKDNLNNQMLIDFLKRIERENQIILQQLLQRQQQSVKQTNHFDIKLKPIARRISDLKSTNFQSSNEDSTLFQGSSGSPSPSSESNNDEIEGRLKESQMKRSECQKSKQKHQDLINSVESNQDALSKILPYRRTMEIMKCPHKNQKHYAKVYPFFTHLIKFYRECAIIAITNMVGIAMLMPALILIDQCMQRASVRIAILMITISKNVDSTRTNPIQERGMFSNFPTIWKIQNPAKKELKAPLCFQIFELYI
ncbi:UNKNOWN [Stylonychia lemnae]|uniref:Transmembrane protein n=1 Tax=Stylonychia lemnae TaxID=5949 RepID=A0A078B5N2_STYLE|nr:UNKNOWN [Stylonychia lemnae]|eukprot:CDW88828.1 UNKNOWN [Stylonychia lemnae]